MVCMVHVPMGVDMSLPWGLERAILACQPAVDGLRRYRVGSFAFRSDGAVVRSRNGSTKTPDSSAHSEYRCVRKCDTGSILFVARTRRDGSVGCAMPCTRCRAVIRARGIVRVYFTIEGNDYGVWEVGDGPCTRG
jgi:tRNA(Arg) A34 adenosine deaminase TadA